jgi:alpha-beta hydrolase superfamily lysophospholipase
VGQLLFNAGIVHRVGPHRLNVRLARRLARRGIPSLRFDLSGLGDSARAAGSRSFDDQAVADLQAAMDLMEREAGVRRFSLLGFCSGGRYGYAAADADPRIVGLVLYDTYAYETPRSRLHLYLRRLRAQGPWRWATGWLRRKAGLAARAARGDDEAARSAGYVSVRKPTRQEYAERIRALHARGVRILVAFSGEGEIHGYRGQLADAFRGLGVVERVDYDYRPGMDHTILLRSWQEEFMGMLEAWTVALEG